MDEIRKVIPDIIKDFDWTGEKKDCGCKGHFWFDAGLLSDDGGKAVRFGIRTDKGILHYIDMPYEEAIELAQRILSWKINDPTN